MQEQKDDKPKEQFIGVAVFAPLNGLFTYRWPPLFGEPQVGVRVRIRFGNSVRQGMVMELQSNPDAEQEYHEVLDCLDLTPVFDTPRMQWLERAARYYLCTEGEMLDLATASLDDDRRRFRVVDRFALEQFEAALAGLFVNKGFVSIGALRKRASFAHVQYAVLQALEQGLVEEKNDELADEGKRSSEVIPVQMTPPQAAAIQAIVQGDNNFTSFLLFGVTGSGKTEVYLRAAMEHVNVGRQVLILVPEIGLTPMWIDRLKQRFERVALWHSAMKPQQKLAVRHRLDEVDVLIGTRSALFLPLPRLGMVVLDEEHDSSFKQSDGVSYSARDMSLLLAQQLRIPVVLGSATPSLESWRRAKQGEMQLLELPNRIAGQMQQQTTHCQVVDMRGKHDVLSPTLISALQQTKNAGLQSILFLNRRGYAPALQCVACGHVVGCPHCSTRLTLHRKSHQLRCHSCDYQRRVMRQCEACGEASLLPLGAGTEQLEEMMAATLPELKFSRFDRDEVRSHEQLQNVLARFASGELDCLIGTQMLVKGHHFPRVALVGVVNADMGIHLPDFRAAERWWQQLTQVMGRAGRGEVPGRVLIQTTDPESPWIQRLGDAHAGEVLQSETELRQMLHFPPFARWVRVVFSSMRADKAEQAAVQFFQACEQYHWSGVRVTHPSPCAIERRARRFRFEVLLRDESRKTLPWKLQGVLLALRIPSGVRRKVEVDPMDML